MRWQLTQPDQLTLYEMLILKNDLPQYFQFRAIGRIKHIDFKPNRHPKIVGNITVYSALNDETPYDLGFFYDIKSKQEAQQTLHFLTQNALALWKIDSDYFVFESGAKDQYSIELPNPKLSVIALPTSYPLENLCIHI